MDFFYVSILYGIGFSTASRKYIMVPDSDQRSADLAYFTFRSIVSANTVDNRDPVKALNNTASPLAPTSPKPVRHLSFKLGNFSYELLS